MAEPTVSELTNIHPEATVNPGVILDNRDAVRQLNQSAQFNAEMHQRRYELGLKNLSSIYQDLGAIQETPVLQQDRPLLNKKMADILNRISENPRAALGGTGFNEIQRELGSLRTLATTSKQDNVYHDFNEKFLKSNPEMDTPANREKLATFSAGAPGTREKFLLDTPVKFDPEQAMGNILKQKQVAVPYANVSFEGPNNEWIVRETGTTYGRDAALKMWNQGYATGTDANNQPIKKWAGEQFEKIKSDPAQMEKFGNPGNAQEFYENLGKMMFGAEGDIVGEKTSQRTANPYTMLGLRQQNALYMEAMREGNREKLAAVRANLALKGAPENANFLVRQYADILGNKLGKTNAVETSKGHFENEEVIDVPAPILKQYADSRRETLREGHSIDPITETIVQGNRADMSTRTKDGNLRLTFYKHYDKADKIPKGKHVGDLVTDGNGNPIIETTGVIPRRNLLTSLGKGVVAPKILSSAIDQADGVLQSRTNEIIDKVNAGSDDEGTVSEQAHRQQHKSDAKKSYSIGGRTLTMDQVEKGAKKYGLSVEDYLKQLGAK